MTYFIVSTTFFLLALILIYWVHTRSRLDILVKPVRPPDSPPLISICVPARNEQRNIYSCIQTLRDQNYPNFEMIVVDDRSSDATPKILGALSKIDPRLKTIQGKSLPDGWAGKPFALHQAARAAHGDWLCFVDADTFLEPKALTACFVKAMDTGADLFTIMTHQIMGTFWEKVLMPLVLTALSVGFSPRRVNNPRTHDAVANGQFILIKNSVYLKLGGHERIKDQIVEDKALAELVKWNGYRLVLADGTRLVHTRMYTSLPEMWEGWTKNIYLGLRNQISLLLLGVLGSTLAVLVALVLPVWPLLGFLWWLNGGGWLALAVMVKALIVWAALLIARGKTARGMGIPAWYAWTTPLGAGIFAAMMITSAWKVLSGRGVSWKGRLYTPAR